MNPSDTTISQSALQLVSYSAAFKDHLVNPRNVGPFDDANCTAEETNPVCGDTLKLFLRVSEGRVTRAGFLAYGCPATIACGSAITELITGRSVEDALSIDRKMIDEQVGGLPPRKNHAAALAIETFHRAVAKHSYGDVNLGRTPEG